MYDAGVFGMGLALFLALFLLGMGLYLVWCAFSISYSLEPGRLVLRCGFTRLRVPLGAVTDVHRAGDAIDDRSVVVKWRGAASLLPGYVVGEGQSAQLGRVFSIATVPASGQVFVATRRRAYGISPQNSAGFVQELNRHLEAEESDAAGETPVVSVSRPALWGLGLWADRPVRLLTGAGLVMNALLWGYMGLVYADLPPRLALHWNAQAQVDRIGDPSELLGLPLFALAIWFANVLLARWALTRERAATLFLLAGAVAVQAVFFAGALSIVLKN